MITGLDHIVLICRDFDRTYQDYVRVFGRKPERENRDDNFRTAVFECENTALEILAPAENSPAADRINQLLGGKAGKLTSLAFTASDIDDARHVLERRGLKPSDISEQKSADIQTNQAQIWRSFRCEDEACAGVKTFILRRENSSQHGTRIAEAGVTSLDHVVINTPNPDRAAAHYGARLGLRLALDRTIEAFHTRFLFFRVGGLTLEIIHRLDQSHEITGPDKILGLTWAVRDLPAEHARLSALKVDVSPIRTGRKPGSNVFTVRGGCADIPTLFIAHEVKS